MMSEDDDTAMRLLCFDHCAFVYEPFEITRVSRVMFFDSPILHSMEDMQTLSLCFRRYK
jgi:hypothetical protein